MEYDIHFKEKKLAIVLLDIVGSTAFVQKVGAAKAARWFQYHDRLARSLCYRFNGREIDRSDGFLLSFESVIDAVDFGLYYQREVPSKIKLQSRIGIHWGSIIEVKQDDLFVVTGAKMIELEGVNKNIAARTMSICGAGQILLTEAAMNFAKVQRSSYTPKGTRYACVGLFKFKGVKSSMILYAVGETIESLQPPKSSDKVKRIGGVKKIRSKARDRKIGEWLSWLYRWMGFSAIVFWIYFFITILFTPNQRWILGLEKEILFLDQIKEVFNGLFL